MLAWYLECFAANKVGLLEKYEFAPINQIFMYLIHINHFLSLTD